MIDIDGILKLLPHRCPFLMIDRVVEVSPGESAVAIKNELASLETSEGRRRIGSGKVL